MVEIQDLLPDNSHSYNTFKVKKLICRLTKQKTELWLRHQAAGGALKATE